MCAISFACANAMRASICKRACFVKKSISLVLSSPIFGPIGKLDGRDALTQMKQNLFMVLCANQILSSLTSFSCTTTFAHINR